MHIAVNNNRLEVVKRLSQIGLSPISQLIVEQAGVGNPEMLKWGLQEGYLDLNTVMNSAVFLKLPQAIKQMFDWGYSATFDLVGYACFVGHLDTIKLLVSYGYHPEYFDCLTVKNEGHKEVFDWLIQQGLYLPY